MPNVWYTSDLHIGHKLVSDIRGFKRIEHIGPNNILVSDTSEHDNTLARNWDAVVRPDDIVFVLGDISINGGQHALDWIEDRPGTKHLVAGNHDPVNPQDRRALKLQPHWLEYFATINPFVRRKTEGHNYLLSHYPYESFGDGIGRPGARYTQYRLPDEGLPLLHGHTHGKERAHDKTMLHVGVDAWDFQLVPQQFVSQWVMSLGKRPLLK